MKERKENRTFQIKKEFNMYLHVLKVEVDTVGKCELNLQESVATPFQWAKACTILARSAASLFPLSGD